MDITFLESVLTGVASNTAYESLKTFLYTNGILLDKNIFRCKK